jgi:hypothetical protein
MTNEASRVGGTASKTNGRVNSSVKTMGIIGKAAGAAAVGVSVYNVVTAENKPQAITREVGALAGAIAGGETGAGIGASIGVGVGGAGAVPGAIVGGIVGSIIGGIAGSVAGEEAYQAVTERK